MLVHGEQFLSGKPDQFRPITCLKTLYKLITVVLSEVLLALQGYSQCTHKHYCTSIDALLVDQMIMEDARTLNQGPSVG